jgi:hypothetical protein
VPTKKLQNIVLQLFLCDSIRKCTVKPCKDISYLL